MHHQRITTIFSSLLALAFALPSPAPSSSLTLFKTSNISTTLFSQLEQLSRIVDISYCVGTSGISHPFSCASRCDEFPNFELVDTFNTGPLMSDSCGYIVLDHGDNGNNGRDGRIIVAFRGTYSIANTIVDLSTVPQEYVPYPGDGNDTTTGDSDGIEEKTKSKWSRPWLWELGGKTDDIAEGKIAKEHVKCDNCTVHSGFWTSWQNTREFVVPHIQAAREKYPKYKLHLVGHSLGGAVAGIAGLEFNALEWDPVVTTFGEPRIGNEGLRTFLDKSFDLPNENGTDAISEKSRYRRITHVDDPVPLLPLHEWGYRSHAGEVFISKGPLQPSISDLRLCAGDEDLNCIAGAEVDQSWFNGFFDAQELSEEEIAMAEGEQARLGKRWGIPIPARYKMWQLFFAHRDYFWRLGLCTPGGDPSDWGRDKYKFSNEYSKGEKGEL